MVKKMRSIANAGTHFGRTFLANRPFLWQVMGIVLILVLILSACQTPTTTQSAATQTSTARPTPTKTTTPLPTFTPTATELPAWWVAPSELDGVQIRFLHPWSGERATEMASLVKNFNQKNEWGFRVEVVGTGSSQRLFQQSEQGIAIGSGAHVVIAPSEELAYWHQQGNLLPLDPFVNDLSFGLSQEQQQDFLPVFWQQDLFGGERLGVPFNRDFQFLIYNSTWGKQLGFQRPPASLDQFRSQFCAAGQSLLNDNSFENNGTGGWIVDRNEYVLLNWMRAFGIADFSDQDQAYLFDQPAVLQTMTFLRGLMDGNCAWVSRSPSPYEYFVNRQTLAFSAGLNDLKSFEKVMEKEKSEDAWQIVPYASQDGKPVLISHGSSYGVFRSNKTQELASWLFIRWMSSTENQLALAKVSPDAPVSQTVLTEIAQARGEPWPQVAELLAQSQPGPQMAEWRVARFVLADAFYQVIQAITPIEQYPQLLKMLDETIASLKDEKPFPGW